MGQLLFELLTYRGLVWPASLQGEVCYLASRPYDHTIGSYATPVRITDQWDQMYDTHGV